MSKIISNAQHTSIIQLLSDLANLNLSYQSQGEVRLGLGMATNLRDEAIRIARSLETSPLEQELFAKIGSDVRVINRELFNFVKENASYEDVAITQNDAVIGKGFGALLQGSIVTAWFDGSKYWANKAPLLSN